MGGARGVAEGGGSCPHALHLPPRFPLTQKILVPLMSTTAKFLQIAELLDTILVHYTKHDRDTNPNLIEY